MTDNSDSGRTDESSGGEGQQVSALHDLIAGGIAGSASVIVGREFSLCFMHHHLLIIF